MSIEAVQSFYKFICNERKLQGKLISTKNVAEFMDVTIELGEKNGFIFSLSDMRKTMSDVAGAEAFIDVEFDDLWAKKVIEMGWVPFGYTK